MTDAPSINYDEIFPALDGSISNNSTATSLASPTNNNNTLINNNNNLSNSSIGNVTNSWSASSQTTNSTGQHQTTKLNYLLLASNNQQQQLQNLYKQPIAQPQKQQQPSQQVLNHLVEFDHNSNDMVTQYQHLQQQRPQQQNQHNSINMQSNPSIQQQQHQKRPGLPIPIISSERCCTFKIAPEERRHRDFELEQSKILKEIMQKTNTKIEVTPTKDGALNFCIIGKEAYLQLAKNLVLQDFQTSVTLTVSVPKSVHGRLLGPKGARLASIQDETQTKIAIPRKEDDSDIIKIVGLKANAEQAVRSIQKYAREFAGKAVEKVSVERIYLLFITGPFNENLKRWEEMGAKVSTSGGILPSNSDRESGHADEVTFTIMGETTAVQQVKEEINQIYEDKKKKCTTVNMEVKKAQHKYILGPNGLNLRNLFAKTGVSVELPQESESETITLRGERSKLAPALSELYTQAHSETDDYFEAETWLHKYLIGVRTTNYIDFKARGVDVKSLDDKIRLHGPPTEVENIKDILEAELETVRKSIIRKDIRVEPRIHGYIIGKAGATVDQIREESGAYVLVPKNDEPSEFITLEGTAEAVAIAEEKINAIAKKYEASRKLVIDQQLHGSIIGRGGEKIKSIREKFTNVVFTFPEQGSKNNEITILGPADEVEECYKYLDEFHMQLQENNHQVQVPIRKDVVKYLSDAQNAIKRVKLEHKVKVDIFLNNDNKNVSPSNKQQQNVSSTTTSSVATANESSSPTAKVKKEATVTPTTTTNTTANDGYNKKKAAGKSKANKKQQQQPQTSSVGSTTDAVTSSTAKASSGGDNSESYAVVIGKKEDVDVAKTKLSKLFEEFATTTEIEIKLNHKLRNFLGPKTRLYRQFLDEFQQKIIVTFPSPNKQAGKQAQVAGDEVTSTTGGASASATVAPETNGVSTGGNSNGKDNKNNNNSTNRIDIVKIRGPKNIAKKAEKRFEALIVECQEKIDKNFSLHTSVETVVIEKFTYQDKIKLNKIRDTQSVKLNIPDRRDTPQLQCGIVGYEKNVHEALKQFTKLVKEVEERSEETIEIASQVHPRLIGAQGRAVKKLMDDFKVNVKFARQGDPNPNSVTIFGRADCVAAAKKHMISLAEHYLSSAGNRAQSGNGTSTQGNNNSAINNSNNNNTNNNSQQYQQQATSNSSEVNGVAE